MNLKFGRRYRSCLVQLLRLGKFKTLCPIWTICYNPSDDKPNVKEKTTT